MTTAMADGRRADSVRRRERFLKALNAMLRGGGDITVSGLVRAARVDRTFLLLEQQLTDTRGQLQDRTDELDAARAANRELTRALNHRA
ncbi:hypothetical protein ACFXO2_38325 [Streptomyces sp. NPDC059152]|uniref:hypothetical protein n=1 Tax=Streptomyces sp. NPDC059152 TaxID=3346742 RepID=UPI003681F1D5